MIRSCFAISCLASLAVLTMVPVAGAQPLGTFRWQLQPFCNVVVVNITQQGAVYQIDGFDDQCGAPQRAPLVGLATPNPDGTIGFGLSIVTVPGGRSVHVDARMAVPSLAGTWSDSSGNSGTFAFGANTGGNPRPPVSAVPTSFTLATDGGFVAQGNSNGVIPATGPGTRLMWHSGKGALRSGASFGTAWDEANVGIRSVAFGTAAKASGLNSLAGGDGSTASGTNSVALGINAIASAPLSVAFGEATIASGAASFAAGSTTRAIAGSSTAFGRQTIASGQASTAHGTSTTASGNDAVAMGDRTIASGDGAVALGRLSTASGFLSFACCNGNTAAGIASVALGDRSVANGNFSVTLGTAATTTAAATGSFVFADHTSSTPFTSFVPSQFIARAAGGVGFYTNAATTTGVELAPNGSSWASLSDVNAKENFRDVDGEGVLTKLAAMSIQEWNYKAQDAGIRHMGPTAQEFRGAFGLGDFPLRINTIDADGVALAAIKALEARTRQTNERLQRENDALRARLARLERLLPQ